MRGWWGMTCFNGLSPSQQHDVLVRGVLEYGAIPDGEGCQSGASVAIEMQHDATPGPRFLCLPCAVKYLEMQTTHGAGILTQEGCGQQDPHEQEGHMDTKTIIKASALEPGDTFVWCGESWTCREKPQFGMEPGFVWFVAQRSSDSKPMDLRIGHAETVERAS